MGIISCHYRILLHISSFCFALQVDSQLACMMNESSVDYIARFNDLAQELSVAETSRKEMLLDSGPPIGDLSQ